MLESVALRLLGCDEYSRPKAITFALDTLTLVVHPETQRQKKSVEEDLKHLVPVRRALMSIPTLRHCNIRSHAKPQDIPAMYFPLNEDISRPHYQVGQRVWCLHGGWGYWPATVFAIEDTCLEILLSWGDMTQVTYNEARTQVLPFMENLAKYSVMSTNQQSGFHDGVEKALAEVLKNLPIHCVEGFAVRPRERFAARMLRIASVFEDYMNDLMRVPVFKNLQKEIARRNTRIAREIEEEERKIVAEQRRVEKEERDAEKEILRVQKEAENQFKRAQRFEEAHMEEGQEDYDAKNGSAVTDKTRSKGVKKITLPLKHMMRNLQEQSLNAPDRNKRKRSVVKSYRDIKIHEHVMENRSSFLMDGSEVAAEGGRVLRARQIVRDDPDNDDLTLLECVQVFHMEHKIQQERQEDKGVQIYSLIYELLMGGACTDDDSLEYCIKHALPSKLIKMLLLKYYPFDIWKGRNGQTLIHLAAQNDFSVAISLLHDHWKKRYEAIHEHAFHSASAYPSLKDGHGRTAVHIACEFGSFKSLKVLQQLGCDLCERDKLGYTPLMWCASKDSPQCAFFLIEHGADVSEEDRKGRSTLWHSMAGDSVFLGKTLFRNGCWMQGNGLQEFVADMSLGREPHKIMFDSRSLAECKAYYLNLEEREEEEEERGRGNGEDRALTTIFTRTRNYKSSFPRSDRAPPSHCGLLEDMESDHTGGRVGRSSSRVVQMSTEVSDEMLAVESSKWELSDHMANVCTKSPSLIPKFVYCTRSYLGEVEEEKMTTTTMSYECCDCEGDCTLNPDCACIMRNGQRSPYSREGLFDFTKGKIFECGDKCSCRNSCKLRMTQKGVAYPLVVCRTGTKGHGVMTTKVIVKGSYVCAYVGERVSEADLVQQEEAKLKLLHKKTSSFVTYAFQIHEGSETFNVDSEYVGNVARFFNHSCDPNLRPLKVVAASKQKFPTMCFFALRRIEAGEELTWKYVTGVRTKKGGQACYCKAPKCTGFV